MVPKQETSSEPAILSGIPTMKPVQKSSHKLEVPKVCQNVSKHARLLMQQKNQHSPTPRKFLRVGRGFHYLHNLDRLGLLTQWDTYLQEGCNINQDSHRQEVIGNPKRYRTSASGTRAWRDHTGPGQAPALRDPPAVGTKYHQGLRAKPHRPTQTTPALDRRTPSAQKLAIPSATGHQHPEPELRRTTPDQAKPQLFRILQQ